MSLTTNVVGALPVTGGTVGSPFAGGFGVIGAHFVGAAGGGAEDAGVVGVGVELAAATADLLPDPPTRVTTSAMRPPTTASVPNTAPRMVLRRRRLARSCCSRNRRRS